MFLSLWKECIAGEGVQLCMGMAPMYGTDGQPLSISQWTINVWMDLHQHWQCLPLELEHVVQQPPSSPIIVLQQALSLAVPPPTLPLAHHMDDSAMHQPAA